MVLQYDMEILQLCFLYFFLIDLQCAYYLQVVALQVTQIQMQMAIGIIRKLFGGGL